MLAVPVLVRAQSTPTIVVGNSSPTNQLWVSQKPCKLYTALGQNLSGGVVYVQVFQTSTNIVAGQVPFSSTPVPAAPQFYSIDFSFYGADLSPGCRIYLSTTATNYTATTNSGTIQAIIGSN